MIKIFQKEETVLNNISKEVPEKDIVSNEIQSVISRMKKALEEQIDGMAIAAPQIGLSLRIFVVSKRAFQYINQDDKEYKDLVFINPKIKKISKESEYVDEGCLSVRWLYGKVKRAKKTTVEALDQKGKKFNYGGSGLMAQIFQHEIDHLDGVLFTTKAKNLEELPPPDNTNNY